VTVLFADVVRSMDIAAAVDAERLREIMTELVERSSAAVHRYGGTVEFTGDGCRDRPTWRPDDSGLHPRPDLRFRDPPLGASRR
jgi:hypothetical protein